MLLQDKTNRSAIILDFNNPRNTIGNIRLLSEYLSKLRVKYQLLVQADQDNVLIIICFILVCQ